MKKRSGLNERLFALWYPWGMGVSEINGQRETRERLVGQARGRTLEIGAGNGYNLPHYTADVTELVVTEPSPYMMRHLERRMAEEPPPVGGWELMEIGAERLPFPDDSFDTVVATFVHCTIPSPEAALREIDRVLRPGGRYLFLEHVRAGKGTVLGRFQDLIQRPHRYVCAGCYPNRDIEAALRASALTVERLEHGTMPRAFISVRPTILGSARAAERPALADQPAP
ncbi:class I SAM-dependent methyltransferase [Actinomadura welshii]